MDIGRTIHVGEDQPYIALYTQPNVQQRNISSYAATGQINYLGIVVDDIDAIEQRVTAEGLTITNHELYEPRRRFCFYTPDGIEIENVSYS